MSKKIQVLIVVGSFFASAYIFGLIYEEWRWLHRGGIIQDAIVKGSVALPFGVAAAIFMLLKYKNK